MRVPALVVYGALAAAVVGGCASDGDDAPGEVADAAACPAGEEAIRPGPGCAAFTDSIVTPSTTKLELKDVDDIENGGCDYSVDLTFDVAARTASLTTCTGVSDGGQATETTELALSSAQSAAMLRDWTSIRKASVESGIINCSSLPGYPVAITRTDSSGVVTIGTCMGSPSYIYDDSAAFRSLLSFFAADGGS